MARGPASSRGARASNTRTPCEVWLGLHVGSSGIGPVEGLDRWRLDEWHRRASRVR